MNLERIAEIEADGMCTMEDETAELIRLARLGLRVEGAPTTIGKTPSVMIGGERPGTWSWINSAVPAHFSGKRVALVVVD